MRLKPSYLLLGLLAMAAPACGSNPTGPPVGGGGYALEIRWLGDAPDSDVQASFATAATRIKAIITGGLSPVLLPNEFNISQCDSDITGFPDVPGQTVNGLIIYVLVEEIDGPGEVLGSAGPCLVREDDHFKPALGLMRLDEEDLASLASQGRLDALILHETLHVVGLGTIWADNDLVDMTDGANARFVGTAARDACRDQNGGVSTCAETVPVHSEGGIGSAYSHWRESTFASELMTPLLGAGAAPLSAMSIRSLADLGYQVSTSTAEAYAVGTGLMALGTAEPAVTPLALPTPRAPRFSVGRNGTMKPIGASR